MTAKLTAFVTALRGQHLSAATVARHLRQLKVAFRWAHRQGLLLKLPEFDRIKQSKAIGPIISKIGKKAGVIVGTRTKLNEDGEPETVNKFASAHDLRRSFGFRWSRRVMPPVLKELMRHTDIATTIKYYVGVNAQATAEELWRVEGNILGNSDQMTVTAEKEQST